MRDITVDDYSTTVEEAAEHARQWADGPDWEHDTGDYDEGDDGVECNCSDPECPCPGVKGYWRRP